MSIHQSIQLFTLGDLKRSPKKLGNFIAVKICFSFLVFLWGTFASAEAIVGRVVSVIDGDTIHVVGADNVLHRIRLAGIDAPETRQAFGQRSKELLSEFAYGKTVTIESDKRDKYGRLVGKVLVNGKDVNLVQVERGMAWWYREYAREQSPDDRILYEDAERAAKNSKIGLWIDLEPLPPWTFRKTKD